jgi:hypothetical protein
VIINRELPKREQFARPGGKHEPAAGFLQELRATAFATKRACDLDSNSVRATNGISCL